MPVYKVTTFLSEISSFFRKNSSESAMFTIMEVIKGINMSEKVLFGRTSRCNKVYSLLQVLQTLLVYPCFMIRNPYNFGKTALGRYVGCKKDVFYRFMNDAGIDWRKVAYHISLQLWKRMRVRSDHQGTTTCLIIDDTDFPKTGRRMESIGRVHSHLLHKAILGYKALFLGITDGVSQMLLDFAILGEKGSRGNFGMSAKDLASRFTKERDEGCPLQERLGEYTMKKTDLTIEMVRRAIRHGVRFRYLLADSWFACASVVKRFNAYETMGELFRQASQNSLELTITERIWGVMLEFVTAMADIFGFDDQDVFDAVIYKSEELAHVCDLYRLKMAS